MITVYVVTPTRAQIRAELGMFREWLVATERRYRLVMSYSDAQPIANNMNRIAKAFLAHESADFLLKIDSDAVPINFNPLDYVEADKDALGFPCPTWRANSGDPITWYPGPPSDAGLARVPDVGGGCLLIARRVLEHPALQAPFLDEWDADGLRVKPEDTSFCHRARGAGFEIWCAMNKPCAHFKTVELATLWRRYVEGAQAVQSPS